MIDLICGSNKGLDQSGHGDIGRDVVGRTGKHPHRAPRPDIVTIHSLGKGLLLAGGLHGTSTLTSCESTEECLQVFRDHDRPLGDSFQLPVDRQSLTRNIKLINF